MSTFSLAATREVVIVALLEYDLLPFILLMKYHVFMLFLLWKPVGRNSDGKSCLVLWPCFMLFQAYIFPWSKAWHNILIYILWLPIQPIITKARQPVLFYSRGGGAVYTACYTTILVQENAPFCGLQLWPTSLVHYDESMIYISWRRCQFLFKLEVDLTELIRYIMLEILSRNLLVNKNICHTRHAIGWCISTTILTLSSS